MLRSFVTNSLRLATLGILLLSSQLARAESFTCYPENEIVLHGVPGTYVTEQLTLVNNLDQEITITAEYAADASLGIDIPSSIVMKAKEKFSFVISYSGSSEAKGYIILMQGNTAKRLLVRGTVMTQPTEIIKVEEYITFGPTATGKTECKTIDVTNLGSTPLTINYELAGYSNGAFNIPTDNIPQFTLSPSETGSISVCFTPAEYDSKEELIFSYSTDGGTTKQSRSAWLLGILERDIDIPCLTTSEKVGIGPVMLGQSAEGLLFLANQTDKPIVITSASISGPEAVNFSLRQILPVVLDANAKIEMIVSFTPDRDAQQFSAELVLALQSEAEKCESATVQLTGWATLKNSDDDRHPIFVDERKTIGVEWGPNVIMKKVIFYNNLDHDVQLTDVRLRDGLDFRIVESSPAIPCMLKPNENFILVLATGMDGKSYFTDEIIFTTNEDDAEEQNYDLQGVKQSASVYDAGNNEIELVIGPNPVVRDLNIAVRNATTTTIEIHDLTGKLVASATGTSYTWNTNATSGAYFVTVTGVTSTGKPFDHTRSVVVR
jgi:hypothetical protein